MSITDSEREELYLLERQDWNLLSTEKQVRLTKLRETINIRCDTDWDWIDKISKIRELNNKKWMTILKIAFQYAPGETSEVMNEIVENDVEITRITQERFKDRLSKKLAEE